MLRDLSIFSLTVTILAIVVWTALLTLMVIRVREGKEHRTLALAMPITGALASVGSLASVTGLLLLIHDIVDSPPILLATLAAAGRGALLMGAIVALGYYKWGPRKN